MILNSHPGHIFIDMNIQTPAITTLIIWKIHFKNIRIVQNYVYISAKFYLKENSVCEICFYFQKFTYFHFKNIKVFYFCINYRYANFFILWNSILLKQ